MREQAFKEAIQSQRLAQNPFMEAVLRAGLKEGLLSDMAGALGQMQDQVVRAAEPGLIGRQIIEVQPTKEALVRFPKAKNGRAYVMAEGGQVLSVPRTYETTDIKTDVEIKHEWDTTKRFLEDATWPAVQDLNGEAGRTIAERETERVLTLYDGIAAADLAGGAVYNGAGALTWAGIVGFWKRIKKENFNATVIVINPEQLADLWEDDKFIHSFYFGELVDVARGVLGQTYLGMKVVYSTKVTDGAVYAVDTSIAAKMLVRRDVLVEPFEDPRADKYGAVATERIGLGVLRSKGVARGTGW